MRYPEFLKENGSIGFVAPSFGCATEPYKTAFKNAQEILTKKVIVFYWATTVMRTRA